MRPERRLISTPVHTSGKTLKPEKPIYFSTNNTTELYYDLINYRSKIVYTYSTLALELLYYDTVFTSNLQQQIA
jgi:hypothetical protein